MCRYIQQSMVVINTEVFKELKCFTVSVCGEEANNSPDCFSKEKKKLAVYALNYKSCLSSYF